MTSKQDEIGQHTQLAMVLLERSTQMQYPVEFASVLDVLIAAGVSRAAGTDREQEFVGAFDQLVMRLIRGVFALNEGIEPDGGEAQRLLNDGQPTELLDRLMQFACPIWPFC